MTDNRAPAIRLFEGELVVDLFAGGGGASVGIERALGRSPDIAINHDKEAISMHRANHPDTKHYIENVWLVDPRKVCGKKQIALMWLSPDCKHFSKAKGGAPHRSKKIRSLANIAVYWAKALKSRKPKVIVLENVEEFQTWGPLIPQLDDAGKPVFNDDGKQVMVPCPARKGVLFRRFVNSLKRLGYAVEWRELVAADYGAPTSRKRLFLIARCDRQPIIWPDATHGPGRAQPWRTAAECIDFALPCPSIFERSKPLAENTQRRIARGIEKFVRKDPFIVPVAHAGDARVHSTDEPLRTVTGAHRGEFALVTPYIAGVGGRMGCSPERSVDRPMQTVTGKGDAALVAPVVARIGQTGGNGSYAYSVEQPLTTVTTKAEHLLVAPVLSSFYGDKGRPSSRCRSVLDPVPTQTADPRFGLVSAFLKPRYGERPGQDPRCRDVLDPMPTVVPTANGGDLVAAYLAKHNAGHEATGQQLEEPVGAVTSRDSKALVATSLVKMRGTNTGQRVTEPLQTVSAQGNHFAEVRAFLMKYHGSGGQWGSCKFPMPTVVANDSLALVAVQGEPYAIVDIGMRMLQPRELFRSHDFPESYVIDRGAEGEPMTKEAQVRMCGNSVPPPMAEAIIRAQFGLTSGQSSPSQGELVLEAA
jgi:DNA (cytosine-5)-methyltransferase 1